MTRTALGLFAVLLLGGCADPGTQVETANSEPTTGKETVAKQEPAAQTAADESVDAEQLLASTLEKAKANGKHVMVHLGAPW